jgi:zinc/manganese transport system permease protein
MTMMATLAGPFIHSYFRHAFVAATAVAVACGLVGWLLLLRNQVFAADVTSHVAFTGGLTALAYGVNARLGVFASCVVIAIVLALFGGVARAGEVVTGIVFTFVLGLGAYELSRFTESRSTGDSTASVRILFGSVFGIDRSVATQTVVIAIVTVLALTALARPLLFSSVDPRVAAARGLPVRMLDVAFLVIAAVVIAQATQVVGALLLLGLLTTPAATAHRLSTAPWRTAALSVAVAVATVWAGLLLSQLVPAWPPSFAIVGIGFVAFVAVVTVTARAGARTRTRRTA